MLYAPSLAALKVICWAIDEASHSFLSVSVSVRDGPAVDGSGDQPAIRDEQVRNVLPEGPCAESAGGFSGD